MRTRSALLRSLAMLAVLGSAGLAAPAHAQDNINVSNFDGSLSVDIMFKIGATTYNEDTLAGAYNITVNGKAVQAYCTDLQDNMDQGESWKATGTTTSAANGLKDTWYGTGFSQQTIGAVDYLAQHYTYSTNATLRAEAQLAIWDLTATNGAGVQDKSGVYSWGSDFSTSGASWVSLSDVYSLEQAGLAQNGASSGSIFENVINGTQSSGGRPQDLAYENPNFSPVPEVSTVLSWGGLLGLSGLGLLARKRRLASERA